MGEDADIRQCSAYGLGACAQAYCEYQSAAVDATGLVDTAGLMNFWLSQLPLKSDKNEAKVVHDQLCRLLEKGDPRLAGKDNANLPTIVNILCKILAEGTSVVSAESRNKLIAILHKVLQTMPQEAVHQQHAQLPKKA